MKSKLFLAFGLALTLLLTMSFLIGCEDSELESNNGKEASEIGLPKVCKSFQGLAKVAIAAREADIPKNKYLRKMKEDALSWSSYHGQVN